jgi:MFS family permease
MTAPAPAEQTSTLKPVGPLFIAVYALALFGIWMAINLPATVTLALRISEIDPVGKTTSYSLAAGIGTLTALIANPLFGRLSDRTRSRFGRRRPWILIGLAGTAVGAVVIGFTNTLPLLILGWILMQAFVNAAIAASLAIVADRIPPHQQGVVGALSGAASSASLVIGVFFIQIFPTSILAQIGLPVATALVFGIALVAIFRDDAPASDDLPAFTAKEFFGSFFVSPRREPDFTWLLLALFLISCAFGVVSTYTVYFLQDQIKVAPDELGGAITLSYVVPGIVAFLVAPLTGWIGDRIGRRKPFFTLTAIATAIGVAVIITATGVPQYIVGVTLVSGVASGLLFGNYVALSVATMREEAAAARNLGVVNIAITLPFSLVPFAAPAVLAIGGGGNYTLLFIAGAVLTLLGILPLAGIRNAR